MTSMVSKKKKKKAKRPHWRALRKPHPPRATAAKTTKRKCSVCCKPGHNARTCVLRDTYK